MTCTYRELAGDLKPGDVVLFADGAVAMVVTADERGLGPPEGHARRPLRSHQGINLPGAALSVKALTDKDLRDLDWTARNPVEYVGLSFVRRADDVVRLREELDRRGVPGADRGQDREAAGGREPRRDHRRRPTP